MIKFSLEHDPRNISNEDLINDITRVAKLLGKSSVTTYEYREHGKYGLNTIVRRFNSWSNAIKKSCLEKTKNHNIPDEELFKNIEEIWVKLRRQPRRGDLEKASSKYSYSTYSYRFGTWRKALEAFIMYVNKGENAQFEENEKIELSLEKLSIDVQDIGHKTKRNINWRLRFIVMKRDNFKCKKCGRSPATDIDVVLHVDHKTAWANGGETSLENLETLCSKCNIGKSNLE